MVAKPRKVRARSVSRDQSVIRYSDTYLSDPSLTSAPSEPVAAVDGPLAYMKNKVKSKNASLSHKSRFQGKIMNYFF